MKSIFFTTVIFLFFFCFFAVSPSRHHKQKQPSGHSGVCCTNSQLGQGHNTFPLESTCSMHQHGNSCPSEAGQLQSSRAGGSAARAAAPAGCILYLSSIGAIGITTLSYCESFWISYALLGSESVNWVLVSLYLIFLNTCLQRIAFSIL